MSVAGRMLRSLLNRARSEPRKESPWPRGIASIRSRSPAECLRIPLRKL